MNKQIRVSVSGMEPGLLLHNPRSANPLDPAAQKLEAVQKQYKKNKTVENLRELLLVQWNCGLYWQPAKGCHIPRGMIQANMIGASKSVKQKGKMSSMAKVISHSISPRGDAVLEIPAAHKTEKDIKKLSENSDYAFVKPAKIGNSLVPVSRPLFKKWRATLMFDVWDETAVSMEDFKEIAEIMGQRGFGDWRPSGPTPGEFGMFSIDKVEKSNDGRAWQKV